MGLHEPCLLLARKLREGMEEREKVVSGGRGSNVFS
jgi:hypothetical protein